MDEFEIAAPAADDELLAVYEARDRLAIHDPRKAELVKLRYFTGIKALGISHPTPKRDWAYARARLYREIKAGKAENFLKKE